MTVTKTSDMTDSQLAHHAHEMAAARLTMPRPVTDSLAWATHAADVLVLTGARRQLWIDRAVGHMMNSAAGTAGV